MSGEQLIAAFGTKDLYEILGLREKRESSEAAEIKQAYRKAALKHHPDKGGDAEKFKACSLAYSILSDAEKKKVYDETGDVDADEGDVDEKSFAEWDAYFRMLYPKLTIAKIDSFAATYKESSEERDDVLKYYSMYKGNFKNILSSVPLSENADIERFCEIIDEAIALNEVDLWSQYEKFKLSSKVVNIEDGSDAEDEEEEGEEGNVDEDEGGDDDSKLSPSKKKRLGASKGKIKAAGKSTGKAKPQLPQSKKRSNAKHVDQFLNALGGGSKRKTKTGKMASYVEDLPPEMEELEAPLSSSSTSSSSRQGPTPSTTSTSKGRKKASMVKRGVPQPEGVGSVHTASALAKFDVDEHEENVASKVKGKTKTKTKAKARTKTGGGDGDEAGGDLAALILANQGKRNVDPLVAIASKYVNCDQGGGKGKRKTAATSSYDDIDDAAFEATQARIIKK